MDVQHEEQSPRKEEEQGTKASTNPGNKKSGAAASRKAPHTPEELLDRLRAYFEENGVVFEEGWRVDVKQRTNGSSAGTCDAYYFSPAGKRYRSRAEIARDHGIAVEKPIRGAGPRRPIVLLSRPEALAKAQERGAGVPVPLALHNGVTVTSFGKVSAAYTTQEELVMIGFSSEWTDEKGIKFISSVVDTGSGPYYTIRAVKADEDPAAVPVEVGAGLSPDVAWQAAAERQQEVMEVAIVHRRSSGAAGGDDGMEPGDHLLVKAATLAGYWGQERFGLADIKCLQALEGQPGVPDTCYQFVEERSSWDEEGRQLLREAGQHGIGRVPMRSISSSRSRAARHPKSKEERDAAIVQRIMDGMIRQLEAGEARAAAAAQRAALRRDRELQRTLEKEQKKLLKEREREIARQLQEQQREMMRMAAIEAARVEEDEVLPTANIPPLMPHPLATGKLPPACEPTLLEAWHLVHRFSELLGIHAANVPSLAQLEAAVLEGPGAAQHSDVSQLDSCSRVIVAMLNFLVADLYQATVHLITENSADVREADLRASNKSPHPIPVTADTWEEVARRYLAVAASAAMAWGKDGGSGLPAPLSALDPHLVLQLLTAGPPAHLAESSANLPRGAAPHAWWGMVVQADAAAMVAASDMLKVTPVPAEKLEAAMKVQRCILMQLANLKGEKGGKSARLLCFQGQGAAAAQKSGRPLDLRAVAARVDAGLYARSADPLSPFVADICYVCGLHQQAANKHTTGFAAENAEKGIAEAAAMVVSEMERLVEDARRSGTSAFLEKYGVAEADAAGTTDHEGGEDGEDGAPVPDANGAAVLDLGRPFAPWEGCAACWGDEDGEKMLECSKCGVLFHSYCHRPPLEEVPDGDWACRRCAGGAAAATGAVKFAPSSGGARLRRMAQKLGATTVAAWEPKERVELLGLVCSLMEDSPALRDRLLDEAADLQDIRKELHAKRSELKHRQQEEAAAAGPEAPGGDQAQETADEAARPAGRRARDVALEIEALVKRISELEHMATQVQPQRLEPIGMDRHWNRYWILPAAALGMQNVGDRPGAVVIERYYLDSVSRGERSVDSVPTSPRFGAHDWQVGIYRNTEALDKLLSWLNPKGVRERALQTELRRAAANIEETARLAQQAKSSEPPRTPMETAMDAAMAAQAGLELSMECLRAALLDFEAGLMPKSRHPELGSPQEMEAWRERVSKARHPTLLMANLLTLESAINPEWLKPHWRPWAMPAPAPASATAPAAVWLRFEALKSATRMKIALHVPISVREVMSGRYGLREQGAKRPAGDAQDSEGSGGDVAASRAARAAKRARKEEDEDEALARQLDAELNAGRRPLRSRLRDGGGSKEGRGNGGRYRGSLRAETKKSYASASEGSEEWEDEDVESSEESEEQEGKVGKKKRGRADSEEEYNSAGDDDDNDA